jgi:glycosyltransferase involved in cell wall biosynthesis
MNISHDKQFVDNDADSIAVRAHPRVTIYSRVINASAVASAYKSAHAFVLPTRGEGWGRPIVEAMAMELPTIASYFSGTHVISFHISFILFVLTLVLLLS